MVYIFIVKALQKLDQVGHISILAYKYNMWCLSVLSLNHKSERTFSLYNNVYKII